MDSFRTLLAMERTLFSTLGLFAGDALPKPALRLLLVAQAVNFGAAMSQSGDQRAAAVAAALIGATTLWWMLSRV